MLLIIIEAILLIGLFIWAGLDYYKPYGRPPIFEGFHLFENEVPTMAFIIVALIFIITIAVGVGVYMDLSMSQILLDEQQTAIEFQIENGAFGDDASLYNLNREIREWNADVKWYREYRDNPWIGLFIPNYLGDYPIFDLVKGG